MADPDLQIRGGPGHPDPEIRGGGPPQNFFSLILTENEGGPGPLGPSLGAVTAGHVSRLAGSSFLAWVGQPVFAVLDY